MHPSLQAVVLKWFGIVIGCVCFSLAFVAWYTTPTTPLYYEEMVSGSPDQYDPKLALADPVRPITDPVIQSAADSDTAANELVIGVEVNGQARAYPINQLTGPQREIINDVLGDTAIAATW